MFRDPESVRLKMNLIFRIIHDYLFRMIESFMGEENWFDLSKIVQVLNIISKILNWQILIIGIIIREAFEKIILVLALYKN